MGTKQKIKYIADLKKIGIRSALTDNKRIEVLAAHLDCEADEISEISYGEGELFDAPGGEYLVLLDSEADEKCTEYIRDSLWAFRSEFLVKYIQGNINPSDLGVIQEQSCEGCNDIIFALVKDRFEKLVYDAIGADGRGHFMNTYDGHEHEEGDFYIYRTN
jgi:hypothetical protein